MHPTTRLLAELHALIHEEREAALRQRDEVWSRPLAEKLERGWTQGFTRLEAAGGDAQAVWAWLDGDGARFREGDVLLLHGGSPWHESLADGLMLELEEEDRWLLRGRRVPALMASYAGGLCYADPGLLDLTPSYEQALEEVATGRIGREVVLPLLCGQLEPSFDTRDVDAGVQAALAAGFDAWQAEAVGMACGVEPVACIQGPPGTGKTRVLALIARRLVERGERVLVTSHTRAAIHNALNRIAEEGVPVAKVGPATQRRGLDERVIGVEALSDWDTRPTDGWVCGATPFATTPSRLEGHRFDTVVFDEASQVTVPLALMAMRRAERYVFIGDQRQLPPVLLSRSVLAPEAASVFGRLTHLGAAHVVMLERTYRMNRWLADWPSRTYYEGRLQAAGPRQERRLDLATRLPARWAAVLGTTASGVFLPGREPGARTRSAGDAALVAELCAAAIGAGLAPAEIGIVTPYRAQGRALREQLRQRLGAEAAREIVADTVERMQGQERELVILSLVTMDRAFLAQVAPFFFQPERLNVSITRARSKLVVIGPGTERLPAAEDPTLARWIAQYAAFIGQLEPAVVGEAAAGALAGRATD